MILGVFLTYTPRDVRRHRKPWIDYSGLIPGAVYGRAELPKSRSRFGITFIFVCLDEQPSAIPKYAQVSLLGVIITLPSWVQYILLSHTTVQSSVRPRISWSRFVDMAPSSNSQCSLLGILALIFTATTKVLAQTHYLIVGAGPAGYVVAEQLSQNPQINVTLLEAGPDCTSDDNINSKPNSWYPIIGSWEPC